MQTPLRYMHQVVPDRRLHGGPGGRERALRNVSCGQRAYEKKSASRRAAGAMVAVEAMAGVTLRKEYGHLKFRALREALLKGGAPERATGRRGIDR